MKAGTTGFGGDLTWGFSENFNIRAGIGYFAMKVHFVDSDQNDQKDAQINLLNLPITLDWYPITGNGFRLSAGVLFNNNYADINVNSGQDVSINDNHYIVSSLNGKVDFNRIAPYIGIGYGNAADTSAHWHFSSDLGVAFVGTPTITLDATALDPSQQDALNNDLVAQRNKYQDDAKPFKFYPVISIGISYTF